MRSFHHPTCNFILLNRIWSFPWPSFFSHSLFFSPSLFPFSFKNVTQPHLPLASLAGARCCFGRSMATAATCCSKVNEGGRVYCASACLTCPAFYSI